MDKHDDIDRSRESLAHQVGKLEHDNELLRELAGQMYATLKVNLMRKHLVCDSPKSEKNLSLFMEKFQERLNNIEYGLTERSYKNIQRFRAVSDGNENTVWDEDQGIDWFPTKSGNRDFACKACPSHMAAIIADALNEYFMVR